MHGARWHARHSARPGPSFDKQCLCFVCPTTSLVNDNALTGYVTASLCSIVTNHTIMDFADNNFWRPLPAPCAATLEDFGVRGQQAVLTR
jgi:hypothetical protein